MIVFLVGFLSAAAGFDALPKLANTCPSEGKPIYVHISGIRHPSGTVKAVLYGPDPRSFLVKGEKTDREREPAQEGTMSICLAAPDVGKYAVVVYHDENDNHKFDRNWIGLPTEGFGVSRKIIFSRSDI